MEIDQYQQRRRANLRWGLGALLFGSVLGNFTAGVVGSPFLLNWLPFEPGIHTAAQWVESILRTGLESLGQVMLVQVLVWWLWRDMDRSQWPVGIALIAALTIGTVLQMYGHMLSLLVFDQGSIHFESELLFQSLLAVTWVLSALAVLWIAMKAAQPAMAIHLVDISSGKFDAQVVDRNRTWSIRELMFATLIVAIVISVFQTLIRYQQQTTVASFAPNWGWISLISITTYCLTNLIVLWSAARYRVGGSSLAAYVALVVATAINLAQQFVTTSLVGSAFSAPYNSRTIIGAAIKITLLFAMHVWVFRKWQQAGYQLRRMA